VADASLLVVKVGSALLTGGAGRLDSAYMHDLAATIAELRDAGKQVVLISSGAVAAGLSPIGMTSRPADLSHLQAAAAVGQPLLMDEWRRAMEVRGIGVAQLLVSRSDFDARDRFLNVRTCVCSLTERGMIPIVNENDSVATEEISVGDNDVLAAKCAVALRADALIILTTVNGVLDASGNTIAHAPDTPSLATHVRPEKSAEGRGGMATKIEAARVASRSGVSVVIAGGRPASNLIDITRGDNVGTHISSAYAPRAGRRVWIALAATPAGTVDIDEGASRALHDRGASLLAKGVSSVTGRFDVGDVVVVRDDHGKEIARGLSNFSGDELRRIMGKDSSEFSVELGRQTHDEVIHRDNLVLAN
jgi:glutamate 5-kinase